MRILFAALVVSLLFSVPVDAAAARAQLVYRVDHVSVSVKGRHMTVTAKGAVRTGGWENPHLRIKPGHRAETHTLVIEFLAAPPAKDEAVIQALLPVSATMTTRLAPYATTEIEVEAEINSKTVPYPASK